MVISHTLYKVCWAQSKIKAGKSRDRTWLGCSCVSTHKEGTSRRAHKDLAKDKAISFGFYQGALQKSIPAESSLRIIPSCP